MIIFKNQQTAGMIQHLINHIIENESPANYDEVVESLHQGIRARTDEFYGRDITDAYQCEINHKLIEECKYEYKTKKN